MSSDSPTPTGLAIRLVPYPERAGHWAVAVRNDGLHVLREVMVHIWEGGIPVPGDLGSTIGRKYPIDELGPSEERRFGSIPFVPGGDYLDLPLVVNLDVQGRTVLTLAVTTDDFDRLETLRAVPPTFLEVPYPAAPRRGRWSMWTSFPWLRRGRTS